MSTESAHLSRSLFFALALGAAGLFTLMTGMVFLGRLHSVDFNLTVKIQDKFPMRFDDNLATLIDFGSMEIQAFLFIVVLFVIPLPKKVKAVLAAAYVAGLAVTLVGKVMLPHPAPPYMFQRGNQGLSFPSLHVQVDSSYPSGHTYRVMFMATTLCLTWIGAQKKSLWLSAMVAGFLSFAVLVMIGLVVLGKHWTSDVVGGIGLAVFLVSSSFFIFPLGEKRPKL